MFRSSKQLLRTAIGAFALAVLVTVMSIVIYGDEEGGFSDVLHFSQLIFVLITVVALVAAGAVFVAKRSSRAA